MTRSKVKPRMPHRLPIVTFDGKEYFRDDRLEEYRSLTDPHDRVTFKEYDARYWRYVQAKTHLCRRRRAHNHRRNRPRRKRHPAH